MLIFWVEKTLGSNIKGLHKQLEVNNCVNELGVLKELYMFHFVTRMCQTSSLMSGLNDFSCPKMISKGYGNSNDNDSFKYKDFYIP
jgi:hypothetical protein